jgi:hypothetical protein
MTTPKGMTDAAASSRPPPPLALPPPDEHILELERLLSLAKVGTHELTSGESSPAAANHLSAAPSWSNFRNNDSRMDNTAVDAADLTQRLNESINESIENDEDDDKDEEPHSAEEGVDQTGEGEVFQAEVDEPLPSSSSSSSEGSGVLVEAPPPLDEMIGTHSEQNKLLVTFQPQPPPPPQQQQGQLSLFANSGNNIGTTPSSTLFRRFYSNETQLPQQLNAIQQQSVRNRQNFQSKIHDVEIKVAELTARLANEEMDRQVAVKQAAASCVHQPLQAVLEQVTSGMDSPTLPSLSLTSRWIAAERRYSVLDAKIYHGRHVELAAAQPSLKQTELDSMAVDLREESLVTAKKEASVARRWETECGILARRYLEERTARIAALQVIGTKLNAVDQRRGQELLETIRELRRKLETEKDERIASDESALDYIVKRTEAVKRAILEAYNNDDDEDIHNDRYGSGGDFAT